MSNSKDDNKLVVQLRNDNIEAFDTLFHRYSVRLYRFSLSLLKNNEDAKEIVQEVFFRIWDKRHEIDSSKSFKSFLFTVSYNLIMDQLRMRLKNEEFRKSLSEYFSINSVKEDNETDFETLKKQVNNAVEKLPPKRKQIYRLSREHGYTYNEIAQELNISIKTVEKQINLSLKHIKNHLSKDLLPLLLFLSLFN